MKKHKMTGCARFFLALIIIAPLAYLGAAYYNGENGLQNIKNFLGIGTSEPGESENETYSGTPDDLRDKIEEQEEQIKKLEDENESLRQENELLRKEIDQLKEPPPAQ